MKRILVTTLGIVGIALGFALPENDTTIVLKQSDIIKYEKHQSNIDSAVYNSKLTGEQIIYIRSQMQASNNILRGNVKPLDTVKKK